MGNRSDHVIDAHLAGLSQFERFYTSATEEPSTKSAQTQQAAILDDPCAAYDSLMSEIDAAVWDPAYCARGIAEECGEASCNHTRCSYNEGDLIDYFTDEGCLFSQVRCETTTIAA